MNGKVFGMSETVTRSFAIFSQEKLKPAVDTVTARRRHGLYLALGVGFALFLLFAAGVYVFFAPYRDLMGEHGISYWPLLFLAPASLGMIGFSLVYILTLRNAVKEFRETLVGKMAEFIDPAIVHESGKTLPKEELEGSLLNIVGGVPLSGTDQFRGRIPGAAVHFSDLRMKREKAGTDGKDKMLTGLYFYAVMERKFAMPLLVFPSSVDVSRGGFEEKLRADGDDIGAGLLRLDDPAFGRQILVPSGGEEFALNLLSSPAFARLEALRRRDDASLYLSCRGDCLRVVLLSSCERLDLPGVFDGFDFGHCREFCRDAGMCLDLARSVADRDDLWMDGKTAPNR